MKHHKEKVYVIGTAETCPHAVVSVRDTFLRICSYIYLKQCKPSDFCTIEITDDDVMVVCNKTQGCLMLMTLDGQFISQHGTKSEHKKDPDMTSMEELNQHIETAYNQPAHCLGAPVIRGHFKDELLIADVDNYRLVLFDVETKHFSVLNTGPISCVGAVLTNDRLYVACKAVLDRDTFPGDVKYSVFDNTLQLYSVEKPLWEEYPRPQCPPPPAVSARDL